MVRAVIGKPMEPPQADYAPLGPKGNLSAAKGGEAKMVLPGTGAIGARADYSRCRCVFHPGKHQSDALACFEGIATVFCAAAHPISRKLTRRFRDAAISE